MESSERDALATLSELNRRAAELQAEIIDFRLYNPSDFEIIDAMIEDRDTCLQTWHVLEELYTQQFGWVTGETFTPAHSAGGKLMMKGYKPFRACGDAGDSEVQSPANCASNMRRFQARREIDVEHYVIQNMLKEK